MLTTRVIPTSGRALVGGIDVVRQPAVAKQLIGVLPQTNTLDRSLTVWENLSSTAASSAWARRHRERRPTSSWSSSG